MDHWRFWSLVDSARSSHDGTTAALERILAQLPREEIAAFDAWLWEYMSAIRREDLWAAVYVIQGGCSDDGFDYFRGWLVGQGEAALLDTVRDPESLAERAGESMSDEWMLGVATRAYEDTYGEKMPERFDVRVEIPGVAEWPADRLPSRAKWTDELLRQHFPRLWATYGEPRRLANPVITGEIDHARFWALIDGARARRTEPTAKAFVHALDEALASLDGPEIVGFQRWVYAYSGALFRSDVRAVGRVVFGNDDIETFAGLRGWVISQGEAVLSAFARDVDSLSSVTPERPEPCREIIHIGSRVKQPPQGYYAQPWDLEPMVVPSVAEWPADWEDVYGRYTPELLHARLPRLTKDKSDESLTGAVDPGSLWPHERRDHAEELVKKAREEVERGDDASALATLNEAVRFRSDSAETLAPRARAKARMGDIAGALADYEAALRHSPYAHVTRLDRAKLLAGLGRREEAIADAQRAADGGHLPARTWLAQQPAARAPTRARHAKFGEGAIVSTEGTGDQQKLVIDFEAGRKTLLRRFVELLD